MVRVRVSGLRVGVKGQGWAFLLIRKDTNIFYTQFNWYIGWSSMEDTHTNTVPIHEVQNHPIYWYVQKATTIYILARLRLKGD